MKKFVYGDVLRLLPTTQNFMNYGPSWLTCDPLFATVKSQKLLLEKGLAVWGTLLQANNGLFESGPDDLPAAAIYSRDAHFDSRPQALRRIGRYLFTYKKSVQHAPGDCQAIAAWMTDEMSRDQNLLVPARLSEHRALATCLMAWRNGTLNETQHLGLN